MGLPGGLCSMSYLGYKGLVSFQFLWKKLLYRIHIDQDLPVWKSDDRLVIV